MAAPEVPDIPGWGQAVIGGFVFLGGVGAMITRFLGAKSGPEPAKSVVLEQAELADLSVIRSIAPKLEQLYTLAQKLDEQKEDLDAVADRQRQILDILGRMDRKEEMRALIREERRGDEERSTPRGR